jgi:cytochrome c peroxidase
LKKKFVILLVISLVLSAFQQLNKSLFTVPKHWPAPLYNFKANPLSPSKVLVGRALFYDPILSKDNTISCASCHSPYAAFTHIDHALSHGIDNKIGTRNSPALMNLAWQPLFMWDGAINHLDMQALAPINHPDEMGENINHVVQKLQQSPLYRSLFYKAFGDSVITGEHLLKAISQFMLTLVSSDAKYDSVMRKECDFTVQEKKGYQLFQQHCATCHREPLFTNYQFKNNGLPVDSILQDIGRMKITKNPMDSLCFKVPTLRNIEFSYPYMHDGRFKKLSEVINHYTHGMQHTPTFAQELQQPIVLSSNEKVDLIAFLLTLSDKHFLFNTNYNYPRTIFFPAPQE